MPKKVKHSSLESLIEVRLPISLIIPYSGEFSYIETLINYILDLDPGPSEVIIVDTNLSLDSRLDYIDKLFSNANIDFKRINSPNSYPGQSRNIGVSKAAYEIIAFLDTKTLPSKDWLGSGYKKLKKDNFELMWGQTFYRADSIIKKAIRASTYGVNPLKTIPGSIMYIKTFHKVGSFIETTRAGEDGEWISRSQYVNINSSDDTPIIIYPGLLRENLFSVIKKWFRNYVASYQLPHLKLQKDIYFYFFAIVLLIIAYNWNNISYDELMRGWNTNSWLYVPNITKISIALVIIPYIFIRSIYLPLKKGSSISYLLAGNIFLVCLISFILDLIKIIAFAFSKICIIIRPPQVPS
jgi:hypothetical protein